MKQRKPASPDVTEAPWSVPAKVADIPESGRRIELAADEATRAAIAKAANLVSLPRLEAVFELDRQGRAGLRVSGHVSATVVQACVVTLEPIETAVEEPVSLVFLPPERGLPAKTAASDSRESLGVVDIEALDEPDPPEVLHGDSIDLGVITVEFLLLGLDPYPRKPGVAFDPPAAETAGPNPFAALAALKKDL